MHDQVVNFTYNTPTKVLFGKDAINGLPSEMAPYGKRVLLVYGGGSIKKTGLYDTVKTLLKDFELFELSGVEPNPRITSVREGGRICREQKIDMVLAVGGGSVLDCAKVICDAPFYDGDPWDLVIDSSKITKALPLFTVLTLAATGSEYDSAAVITNLETNEKIGVLNPLNYPKVSVLDPTYTLTVSKKQTAAGSADIMSHIFEQYFVDGSCMVTEGLCESVLRSVIKFAKIAYDNGNDYTARANLMWSSSLACNGICQMGSEYGAWVCHAIEHELSAYYDITHGEGLALLTPVLMRYTLNDKSVKRYAYFANRVFGIELNDDLYVTAKAGIEALEQFFASIGLPKTLRDVGIDSKEKFDAMAEHACKCFPLDKAFVPLTPAQVREILDLAF
ncbi:MAG: iron-containing alcohol dehydrogenase [Candidatus Anaerobiospirillum merdipullorum]|uniref:Iron-containing alcohol dehydrogenase n=1 Tax=Candidatus Anaerobiospirillum merdipullorum TaxID=2838450 RepID=A0A9E2KMK6_9GAMM|nr:iron-containing alcohol dehydrogenase [Candidatus Anaerobiospirillum merdipullorum]